MHIKDHIYMKCEKGKSIMKRKPKQRKLGVLQELSYGLEMIKYKWSIVSIIIIRL